jgi:hypothetical protein
VRRDLARLCLRAVSAWAFIVVLASCSSGKRIAKANDALRLSNHELSQEVLALKRRNNELEIELQRLAQQQPEAASADILQNLPRIVEISIGRLSHVRDADRDGQLDSLLVYLQPVDGLGRFTQMVGTVEINAASVPSHGDPVSAGQATFAPRDVRDAYRSSLTGVHYTFEVPIELPAQSPPGSDQGSPSLFVRVTYHDGQTGHTLTAERSIPVNQ